MSVKAGSRRDGPCELPPLAAGMEVPSGEDDAFDHSRLFTPRTLSNLSALGQIPSTAKTTRSVRPYYRVEPPHPKKDFNTFSYLVTLLDHPEAMVSEFAVWKVRKLACDDVARSPLLAANVLGRLVALLQSANDMVVEGAAGALCNFAAASDELRLRIANKGFVRHALRLLQHQKSDVVEQVVSTFISLIDNEELIHKLLPKHGIEAFVKLLRHKEVYLAEQAAYLLKRVAMDNHDIQHMIADFGAVSLLAKELENPKGKSCSC